MGWNCQFCGHDDNEIDSDPICTTCSTDRNRIPSMLVERKRRVCYDCNHMHMFGLYCHVFTENTGGPAAYDLSAYDDDDDDDEVEENTEKSK